MIFKIGQQGVDSIIANPYGSTALPSLLQILSFIIGTILIIAFGITAFKKNPTVGDSEKTASPDNGK